MKKSAILLLLLASLPNAVSADGYTAKTIYQWCTADQSTDSGKVQQLLLIGFVQGAVQASQMYQILQDSPIGRFCVPVGSTSGQTERKICAGLELDQSLLSDPASLAILKILSKQYPCKK